MTSSTCFLVTGAAGFIGSNLVNRLLELGHQVVAFDNFSTGQRKFLAAALKNPRFTFVEGDLLDEAKLKSAFKAKPVDMVFHLAANADIKSGLDNPRRDLEQNTIATFNVLNAMREAGVKRIGFSSTGSVYGEAKIVPTPENAPFPVQTSLYAASKLAGEGMIQAFAEGFGMTTWIFRFVSVLGEHYTHGHVFDFYQRLQKDPKHIEVLGDGMQNKSYMYVQDCIDAMLLAVDKAQDPVNIFNLGFDGTIRVRDSLKLIIDNLGLNPAITYTGGRSGWVGDVPLIHLDCSKIRALGWNPKATIEQSVVKTLSWLKENPWVYEARS